MTVAFNYLGKLGQLGNQMFQYAATLGVARKLGIPFTIQNHKEIVKMMQCRINCSNWKIILKIMADGYLEKQQ